MHAKHTALHLKLTMRFPPDTIQKWEADVIAWEMDNSRKNPYEEHESDMIDLIISSHMISFLYTVTNLKTVQVELAQEEYEGVDDLNPLHDVSPNRFLMMGLEIEERQ